jgi:glycerate dehydrogenase
MKIIALDGYTLNPGDISWTDLKTVGDLTVYDRTQPSEVISRAQGAEILLTNKTILTREMMLQLPQLKFISVLATGYNIVDVGAAKSQGILVSNAPGYGTASVVQLTFALMFEFFNQVSLHSSAVAAGEWVTSKDFSFSKSVLTELNGKTLGLIGFGSIGQQVCDVSMAFGMRTVAYSRTRSDQRSRNNFRWMDLFEVYKTADILSIHCPLTDETKGMINNRTLSMMKKSAFLINTARGQIIVEEDLAHALNTGVIAGAGLDVLSVEPPQKDNPLLSAKNCIITPHIGWATKEARGRLMSITINNVKSYIDGKPINVVNG